MSNKNLGIAAGAIGAVLLFAVAYAIVTSNDSNALPESAAEYDAEMQSDEPGARSDSGVYSQQRERTMTVPAGTVLSVQFNETVSTETSQPSERFSARVVEPVSVNGEVVIESGSTVTGSVVEAVRGKKIGGKSRLNLQFTNLELPSGEESPISASFYEQGKSSTKKDAATIGGATAGGAVLGRIIGHQRDDDARGTTIGAVVGAAVGTAVAATNERNDVTIPAGTTIQIRLDSPVTIST